MNSERLSYLSLNQKSSSPTSLNLQSVQFSYVNELDRIRNISTMLLASDSSSPLSDDSIKNITIASSNKQNTRPWISKVSNILVTGVLRASRAIFFRKREVFSLESESASTARVESGPAFQIASPDAAHKPTDAYVPKGVLGFLKISLKRYILNIWDHNRTPQTWAKSVSTPSFPTATSSSSDGKNHNSNGYRDDKFYVSSSIIDRDETSHKTNWIIQQREKQLHVETSRLKLAKFSPAVMPSPPRVGLFSRIKYIIVNSPSNLVGFVKRRLPFRKQDQGISTVDNNPTGVDEEPDDSFTNEYEYYKDFDETNDLSRAMSPAESRSSGRGRTSFSNLEDAVDNSNFYYNSVDMHAGLRVLRQEILPSYVMSPLSSSTAEMQYTDEASAPIVVSGARAPGLSITSLPVVGNIFNVVEACFSVLPFSKKGERKLLVLPASQQSNFQGSEGGLDNITISRNVASVSSVLNVNASQLHSQSAIQPRGVVEGGSRGESLLVKNELNFPQVSSAVAKNDGVEFVESSVSSATRKSKMALAAVSQSLYNTNSDSTNDNYTVSDNSLAIADYLTTSAHLSLNTQMQIESDEDIENLVKQGPLDYKKNDQDSSAGTIAGNIFSRAAESMFGAVGGAVGAMGGAVGAVFNLAVSSTEPLLKPSSIDNTTEARVSSKPFVSFPEGSLPWDVHFRAPIPFFENALKGPQDKTEADYVKTEQGKQLTQNLVAQFLASDAIDEKYQSVEPITSRPATRTVASDVSSVQGFFIQQVDAIKNKFNNNDNRNDIKNQSLGKDDEVKTEVSQLIKDVFPLVTNTVKAIDGMRQQVMDKNTKQPNPQNSDLISDNSKPKINALNMVQKSSIQNPNMNGPSSSNFGKQIELETALRYRAADLHSVSGLPKGSALPGDGIGLGLGLDPAYVDAVRQDEVLGIIAPTIADIPPSDHDIVIEKDSLTNGASEDVAAASVIMELSTNGAAPTATAAKKDWLPVKLVKGIYKYTAKPVVQAPWILVRWIRNKQLARGAIREARINQATAASIQSTPNSNVISKDDVVTSPRPVILNTDRNIQSNSEIVPIYTMDSSPDRGSVSSYFPLSPVEAVMSIRNEPVTDPSAKAAPTTQGMTFLNLNFPLPLPMRKNLFSSNPSNSVPSTGANEIVTSNTEASSSRSGSSDSGSSKEDLLNVLLPDPYSQLQQESVSSDADERTPIGSGNLEISTSNIGDVSSMVDTTPDETADAASTTPAIEMVPSGARDLRMKPQFVVAERIPIPTKADFAFIETRRIARAVSAARAITNEADAREFMRDIGINVLLSAMNVANNNFNMLIEKTTRSKSGLESASVFVDERVDVVIAICRLLRMDRNIADLLAKSSDVVNVLMDMMEGPFKHVANSPSSLLQISALRERDEKSQRQAVALMLRILRSSDVAINTLKHNSRLRNVLQQIADQGSVVPASSDSPYSSSSRTVVPSFNGNNNSSASAGPLSGILNYMPFFSSKNTLTRPEKSMVKGNITIADYPNLKTYQMARVASWALGGVPWKPRQPGQKGLRILSLDGGGTKGVLTVALLKELMQRINKHYAHEVFDIICGTSTGAIIAALLGLQMRTVEETEDLYDDLIDRIFSKKSNLKLLAEQASYDEQEWERILYALTGEEMMLDSNRYNSSRVFMVSTKLNNNPPGIQIWRNYNYAPHLNSRYGGSCRVNVLSAVRATTAAPTFFTPIPWQGGLYGDGALVANNPTAIALQEAKLIYPGVPIELVVSIGTGLYSEGSNIQAMGWDLLVNHIIATSVSTEDVHVLLTDFLPPEKYFRFNPMLQENVPIDVLNKTILADMKRIAKESFVALESGHEGEADTKRFEAMIANLRGSSIET